MLRRSIYDISKIIKSSYMRSFVGIAVDPHYNFKDIVESADVYKNNLKIRNRTGDIDEIISLYTQYGKQRKEIDDLKMLKNKITKETAKDPEIIRQSKEQKEINELYATLISKTLVLPNLTSPETPIGPEENASIYFFNQLYLDIVTSLKLVDFESATQVTGPRFTYLQNGLVFWEYGILMYVLNKLSLKGYICMETPDLVQQNAILGCGFNPRGESTQIYNISNGNTESNVPDLSLIGTSEIPLACYNYNKMLPGSSLPLRYCGISHCFRREAGATGAKDKGLYRVHQFNKVEMYHVCLPSQSALCFDELVSIQKEICSEIGLHARVLEMPTEELGNSAYRKIDFEAYMPGRGDYGEICSISNCTDYQSRRLNIRSKINGNRVYCHTLNGTAVALPRLFVAILETFQNKDGSVSLPDCFKPYVPERFHKLTKN
ncbi:hypothetical protein WA158_008455 [Blastocystis sp. Blastoise]